MNANVSAAESLTVAALQEELRERMPEVAELLDAMKDVRQIQELAAQLAGPVQFQLVTTRTTALVPQHLQRPAELSSAEREVLNGLLD